MAAPTFVKALNSLTDAGGAWAVSFDTSPTSVGDIIIFHVLQDGATTGAVALTTITAGRIEDLAGTDNAVTFIGEFAVGGSAEARQYLWIGRVIATTGGTQWSGTNSTSEDVYPRAYEFTSCSTGTTLATVIENVTAGATVNSTGTSATAADASVTTTGPDRLALNLVAVNDDNAIGAFTGQSGGTWVEAVAEFAESSGTDGMIQLQTAAMASAGTIDGGTASITDSDAWGVVGFALIGTTVVESVPRSSVYPQLLAH